MHEKFRVMLPPFLCPLPQEVPLRATGAIASMATSLLGGADGQRVHPGRFFSVWPILFFCATLHSFYGQLVCLFHCGTVRLGVSMKYLEDVIGWKYVFIFPLYSTNAAIGKSTALEPKYVCFAVGYYS